MQLKTRINKLEQRHGPGVFPPGLQVNLTGERGIDRSIRFGPGGVCFVRGQAEGEADFRKRIGGDEYAA